MLTQGHFRGLHILGCYCLDDGAMVPHNRLRLKEAPKRWGGNVFVQVIDPDLFAGREAFTGQMDHLSQSCRASRPIRSDQPVRMPGDQAARGLADAQKQGIACDEAIWQALTEWANRLGVATPVNLPVDEATASKEALNKSRVARDPPESGGLLR